MTLQRSRVITVSIDHSADRVYAYIRDGANFSDWLSSFVRSATRNGDGWLLDTADGPMGWRFVPDNDFGVLDHYVTLPNGDVILNPMRVVSNGAGSEVLFTLFQRPGVSDEEFAADAVMVERDLNKLKSVLEAEAS